MDDGGVLRDHLASVERQTGRTPPELISPPFPSQMSFVWATFQDLHDERRSDGFGGVSAISSLDMLAWCAMTQVKLSPFEVKAIKAVDRAFRTEMARQDEKKRKAEAARRPAPQGQARRGR